MAERWFYSDNDPGDITGPFTTQDQARNRAARGAPLADAPRPWTWSVHTHNPDDQPQATRLYMPASPELIYAAPNGDSLNTSSTVAWLTRHPSLGGAHFPETLTDRDRHLIRALLNLAQERIDR